MINANSMKAKDLLSNKLVRPVRFELTAFCSGGFELRALSLLFPTWLRRQTLCGTTFGPPAVKCQPSQQIPSARNCQKQSTCRFVPLERALFRVISGCDLPEWRPSPLIEDGSESREPPAVPGSAGEDD
jgi:hypothetical protein